MLAMIASAVFESTGIPTTASDVRRVLAAAQSSSDLWQMVNLAHRPFNQTVETVRVLAARGFVVLRGEEIVFTETGLGLCRDARVASRKKIRCAQCSGRGIDLGGWAQALERFARIGARRPIPIEQYDQAFVTPESTMARLAVMADRGDLEGRRVLVLGDDDLMGIGAALTGLPRSVHVLEIDERIVAFIQTVAKQEGLTITTESCDLREPLPPHLRGAFDTFFTDPPDTVEGLDLFIGRGLSALDGAGGAGYFGVTFIESSPRKWRDLQRVLVGKYGVTITDIIDDFSTYENWDYLIGSVREDLEPLKHRPRENWYRSSLYRIEKTDEAELDAEFDDEEGLYVGRESLLWTRGQQ